jgi:hypothetical protein
MLNGYNKEQQHQLGYVEMGATTKSSSINWGMLKWVQQQRAAAAAAAVPSGAEQKQDQWGRKGEEGRWTGKNNNICGVRDKALSVRSHPQAKGPFTTLSLSLSLSLCFRY